MKDLIKIKIYYLMIFYNLIFYINSYKIYIIFNKHFLIY